MKVSTVNKNKVLFSINSSAQNKPSCLIKLLLNYRACCSCAMTVLLSRLGTRSLKWLLSYMQMCLIDAAVILGRHLIISNFRRKRCKFMPAFGFSLALASVVSQQVPNFAFLHISFHP